MMLQSQQDVLAFLEANLETALLYVENIYGITLDRWKFMETCINQGKQYPSISILAQSTGEVSIGPGNSNGAIGSRRYDNINIVVWHRGNKTASRKIEDNVTAYMDALDYLFENNANMDLPRKYQLIRATGTDYTDLLTESVSNAQSTLLKGAVFTIEIRPNY